MDLFLDLSPEMYRILLPYKIIIELLIMMLQTANNEVSVVCYFKAKYQSKCKF